MKLKSLLVAAALTAAPAFGQTGLPTRAGQPGVPQQNAWGMQESPFGSGETFSVDFDGGTIAEFLKAVEVARGGKAVNVLVTDAGGILVDPLKLTNVSVESAMEALQYAARTVRGQPVSVGDFGGGDGEKVYALRTQGAPRGAGGLPRSDTMVLSLNGVTKPAWANGGPDGLPVETVLTAVETAIMMAGQDEQNPPTMRFHRESGLLIVKGTPEQLSTAGQVVESLSVDVRNAARKSVGESQVRTYPSLHTPAEELAEVVRYVFPPEASGENRVELSIAAEQNGLVVKAPAEWQNAVAAAIRAADRRRVPDAEAERRTLQLEAMAQELMNARKMAEDSQSQGLELRAKLAEFQAMKEAMDKQMNAATEEADRFRAMMDKRDAESRQLAHERDTLMAAVRELQAQLKASGGATAPK
jgi:hypothetical protein